MARTENTLGAPTEGLGQTVTFGVRDDPGVQQLNGIGNATELNADVRGSGATPFAQEYHPVSAGEMNPTTKLLMSVAGSVLQGYANQKKAESFVTGMQRAAAGEAIKDIANGEPWYSRIFGESDVVEGARAYTAQAKASEVASAVEDSMQDVRKMDAPTANAYFTKLVRSSLTGDDVTDAAVMQSFARTLPATMRRQAKEHYAWRQEEASNAESSALLSAADLLQKRASGDKQTDAEYANNAVQLIAGMRPAQGRDITSWTKARTQDILQLAQAGKFHAVNVIKQSGMLDILHPDQRTRIESAIDTAENRTIANKSFEYAPELARIAGQAEVYSTDLNPNSTFDQLKELNERFRKETGIDRDLVTLDKGERIVKDAHVTLLREGERRIRQAEEDAKKAATQNDKDLAQLQLKLGASQAIALGQAGAATRAAGMTHVVGEQFLNAYRALAPKGPDAQASMLMLNYTGAGTGDGYVNSDIRDTFERRAQVTIGAQMPMDFLQLHDEYAALKRQSPALADSYFGKMADRMAVFDSLLTDGKPGSRGEAAAFVTAFGSQEPPRFKALSEKERKQAAEVLADQHDAPMWKFWKQQREPLRADQIDAATHDMDSLIAKYRSLPGTSLEAGAQRAFAERRRDNGADMVGGFYIKGGAGQQPLTNILRTWRPGDSPKGTGEDEADVWDKAVKGKISQMAERIGSNVDDPISIVRVGDSNGVARMVVYFTPANGGAPVGMPLTSDDIKNYARDPKGRSAGGPITTAAK